jgi:SAM-dependent methyltransferase
VQPDHTRAIEIEATHDDGALERALAAVPPPRSPELLLDKFVALGVDQRHLVVDLGSGHGEYAQQIVAATGCTLVALDVSAHRAAETRDATAAVPGARVIVATSLAEALPLRPQSVDVIWCRDMLNGVDLPRTMGECATALRPGGHMLAYQSFATDLLEPIEAQRLYGDFALVAANMDAGYWESCARDAGFAIVERDEVGGEWREWWEADGGRKTSQNLLRASQLVRDRERLTRELGASGYAFAMADQLWGIYQLIGKLCPTIYLLRRT